MLTDYTGPSSRLTIEKATTLDARRWAVMPKLDGCYARITTDSRGRVARVLSRAARELREAADLLGVLIGPPDSVFHGELEAHTEAGNRIAACRGWRNVHLFDATRIDGRNVAALPYSQRYGELHRAQAVLEQDGLARYSPWRVDADGNVHDRAGRFTRPVPRDLRRFPIVPLHRGPSAAEQLWRSHVEVGGGEGLVAVALDAPVGKRGSKLKVKSTNELDATVVAVCETAASLVWRGHVFHVSARGKQRPAVGQIWSCLFDGFYEDSVTPRFARLSRLRSDLG